MITILGKLILASRVFVVVRIYFRQQYTVHFQQTLEIAMDAFVASLAKTHRTGSSLPSFHHRRVRAASCVS